MNVALVSCGPSASAFAISDHEGPIIAVSRMATKVRADYWACFDYPVAKEIGEWIIGFPRLYSTADTVGSLARRKSQWSQMAIVADTLDCPIDDWMAFTAPACLVLGAAMGATRIDCFGVDMAGTGDATGGTEGNPDVVRTAQRWEREREIWESIVGWVGLRGVEVERHGIN